jgi:hypothetical protein
MEREMSETSLEDMLSDKDLPEATETEEAEETKGTGETEETTETETDKETETEEAEEKKDDSTPESKASETTEDEPWTKKAVLDERRKRQELEQRLRDLESKKEPEPAPDWWADPEKAAQHQSQQIEARLYRQKVELSQDFMRSQHEDYDDMEARFMEMAQENPALRTELQKSANPARFAYETARKASEYEAMKDVDSYKAKVEADVRKDVEAKVRKEIEAEQKKKADKEAAIDPSLASTSSKGGLTSDDYAGPTPLDEILK